MTKEDKAGLEEGQVGFGLCSTPAKQKRACFLPPLNPSLLETDFKGGYSWQGLFLPLLNPGLLGTDFRGGAILGRGYSWWGVACCYCLKVILVASIRI